MARCQRRCSNMEWHRSGEKSTSTEPRRWRGYTSWMTLAIVLHGIAAEVSFPTDHDHYRPTSVRGNRSCVHLPGVFVDGVDDEGSSNKMFAKPKTVCDSLTPAGDPLGPAKLTDARNPSQFEKDYGHRRRQGSFDHDAILSLHNVYRSTVEPPAADMSFMEWHDVAAMLAQQWAENCVFEHGFPDHPLSSELGQNLYLGPDTTGLKATRLWFEENIYFNIRSLYCRPNEMCGHYTQGAWAKSKFLGCGIAQCSNHKNLIVCHYYPKGNYADTAPYEIGQPCSLCHEIKSGGLCYNNTCVSQSVCKSKKLECGCPLHCHNCGQLDEKRCRCQCKPGWDKLDCSEPCINVHHSCGRNPGFPDIRACTMDDVIKTTYCRQMCHQCNAIEDLSLMTIEQIKDLCCAGKVCKSGYILSRYCTCVPKCPGPACSGAPREQVAMPRSRLSTFFTFTILFYVIMPNLH